MIATTNPTEILMQEHEVILKALNVLSAMAGSVDRGARVPMADVEGVIDFFRSFTDGCHHAKEEKALFPAMEAAGMPHHVGPVAVMLHEHELGRGYMRAMAESLGALESSAEARRRFVDAVCGYETLLTEHINKENNVLFSMADQMLSADKKREIADAFERHEREELGDGRHEYFHGIVKDLAARYLTEGKGIPLGHGMGHQCCGGGHCS